MKKEERKDKALEAFKSGFNCSQSVFAAYCDLFDVDETKAVQIGAGFGAGIGRLQKTCGAVSGAVMLIGLRYYDESDTGKSKGLTYEKVREFISKFEEKNGTVSCLDLLGVDLSTEEGARTAKETGLFETKCEKFIGDVCDLLEEHLFPVSNALKP